MRAIMKATIVSWCNSGLDSLWKISSETYMNQKNSPHSTALLKSNDKRAVSIKLRLCCCNWMRVIMKATIVSWCNSGLDSLWKISSEPHVIQKNSPIQLCHSKVMMSEQFSWKQDQLCCCNARACNHESHGHALIYCGIDSLWKISSETYMNQTNSPHSTAPLKGNDKRAVFITCVHLWVNRVEKKTTLILLLQSHSCVHNRGFAPINQGCYFG